MPLSIVGARLYYILFYLDLYRREDGSLDFGAMVRIWDGGLAIYGGVIMAVVVLLVFCKVRQIRFLAFADLGVFGMLIGQMIGRWGNFVNIEAYGGPHRAALAHGHLCLCGRSAAVHGGAPHLPL